MVGYLPFDHHSHSRFSGSCSSILLGEKFLEIHLLLFNSLACSGNSLDSSRSFSWCHGFGGFLSDHLQFLITSFVFSLEIISTEFFILERTNSSWDLACCSLCCSIYGYGCVTLQLVCSFGFSISCLWLVDSHYLEIIHGWIEQCSYYYY